MSRRANCPTFAKRAKKFDIPIAVNPGISQLKGGSEELLKALPFIDALILNSDEAKTVYGHTN